MELGHMLGKHAPFNTLTTSERSQVAHLGTELSYRPQHHFCYQGETAKSCALVLSGGF